MDHTHQARSDCFELAIAQWFIPPGKEFQVQVPPSDASVSQQYFQTVNQLYQERLAQQITDQELGQRLDEAMDEETRRQKNRGPVLIKQVLTTINQEILENQTKTLRVKQQQEEEEQKLQHLMELQKKREREQEQQRKEQEWKAFRTKTTRDIQKREGNAQKLQQQYNILQIILLVFSAITATMAGIDGVPRGWVAVTGVIATIAGGILTTFKIQDRIYANRKAVTNLKMECQKYDYHIDEYKGINAEEAFIKFTRTISGIQGEQMLQEVEFWNPRREKQDESKKDQLRPPADTPELEAKEAKQAPGKQPTPQEEKAKTPSPDK